MELKVPDTIKGFTQHGVSFVRVTEMNFAGSCPFCGSVDKFFANGANALWDCKKCIISGNLEKFLTLIQNKYQSFFINEVAERFAENRGLEVDTLRAWGVGYSPWTREYMIPENGNAKRITYDIERYQIGRVAYGTSGGKHQLVGPLEQHDTRRAWVCEGWSDGAAWWECLSKLDMHETIWASPGAGAFPQKLASMFQDKDVYILFDNDDPGRKGAIRTGNLLSGYAKSIKYLRWPPEHELKEGYDIRDLYTSSDSPKEVLEYVLACSIDSPPEIVDGKAVHDIQSEEVLDGAGLMPEEVLTRYREYLHLRDDEALHVIFGTAFANRLNIDPLWMFIVAPPGGSKTELLMSLSSAPKIHTTTSVTPPALISGHQNSGKDPSLIPKLNGKTLIIKDFTTILNMNQTSRDEIFGVLRDVYDGKIEKSFGNGVTRRYVSRFGILAGVTPVIEGIAVQSSILGERFIKYTIKQTGKIDVGSHVIQRALANLNKETDMRSALSQIGKEVLGRNIDPNKVAEITPSVAQRLQYLGQLIAALRGAVSKDRYTGQVLFKPCSEIGTRLAKQFGALALGISVYRQEDVISEYTMKVVCKVASDTAPDRVEEIVRQMYKRIKNQDYGSTAEITHWTKLPSGTISTILGDLCMLHVIQKDESRIGLWRLSPSVIKLIRQSKIYDA